MKNLLILIAYFATIFVAFFVVLWLFSAATKSVFALVAVIVLAFAGRVWLKADERRKGK